MRDLSTPTTEGELMDRPDTRPDALARAYRDLAFSNRWLGGITAVLRGVESLVRIAARDGATPVTILDVAAGGGDVAVAIARWARRQGLPVHVIALDRDPTATSSAAALCGAEPAVSVVRGDVSHPPMAPRTVDIVHAGQFLHHVPRSEQAQTLRALARLPRVGLVVTDLRRTRWAHEGVRAFAWLTRRGPLYRHDAPVSVARGFTDGEAAALANACGMPTLRVERQPFARLTWLAGPFAV